MQCNQSFCGHGFNNSPFYCCNNTPLQCNANTYSDIVGEGVVTSLTLPDGTIQLFFKPTLKWWTPNTFQPNIPNPMMQNSLNYNIPYMNNTLGTWFIRSINNPLPPNLFSPSCSQFDTTKLCDTSECNLNPYNNGYRLKFHTDHSTSTTDIMYFYPCLRRFEYTYKPPTCRGTAAVQVETLPVEKNTVCHYQVKCNCHKPMSLVSIAEPKKKKKYAASPASSCEDTRKKRNKRSRKHKSKSKHVKCECESTEDILKADKSMVTFKNGSCCTAVKGRDTQTSLDPNKQCCSKRTPIYLSNSMAQRCDVKDNISWHPVTPVSPVSEREMRMKSLENLFNFSDTDYTDDDYSSISSCSDS